MRNPSPNHRLLCLALSSGLAAGVGGGAAAQVPPGDLFQLVAQHSGKCLDVNGDSPDNGAIVQQWVCGGPEKLNQLWSLRPLSGATPGQGGTLSGTYTLVAAHSGKCLDVSQVSTADGAAIHQWECLGSGQQNQVWNIQPVPGGDGYTLIASHSGQCLDVYGVSLDDGGPTVQWPCQGPDHLNQLWSIRPVAANTTQTAGGDRPLSLFRETYTVPTPQPAPPPPPPPPPPPSTIPASSLTTLSPPTYRIRAKATGRYLHEDGNGDRLVSTRYQPDDDFTRFTIEDAGEGTYRIRVKADGRFLHEHGNGDQLVSTRWQFDDDFSRFTIEPIGDGTVRIRTKATGRFLHEHGLGDRIVSTRWQFDDDYSRFILEPVTQTVRIRVKATGRYLHEHGLGDLLLSTRWQVDDDYTRFIVEPELDGTVRLRVKADGRYLHEDGLGDHLLSTRWQVDDDYTRFIVEPGGDGTVRLRVKATGSYFHEDGNGDRIVSTRWQPDDDFTRFYLIPETSTAVARGGGPLSLFPQTYTVPVSLPPPPPPPGYIELLHEGAYAAFFRVDWTEPDAGGNPIRRHWESGDLPPLLFRHILRLPGEATDIRVRATEYPFPGFTRRVFNELHPRAPTKCYKIYGTTLDPGWRDCTGESEALIFSKAETMLAELEDLTTAVGDHLQQVSREIDPSRLVDLVNAQQFDQIARMIRLDALTTQIGQLNGIGPLPQSARASDQKGFQTLTVGVAADASLVLGGTFELGVAFDLTGGGTSPNCYFSLSGSAGPSEGVDAALIFGVWADNLGDTDGDGLSQLQGESHGVTGAAALVYGLTGSLWWQAPWLSDPEHFLGFQLGVEFGEGIEGEYGIGLTRVGCPGS